MATRLIGVESTDPKLPASVVAATGASGEETIAGAATDVLLTPASLAGMPLHDVHLYDAVGDGVADDTTPLRNALAGLPASGGTILLRPGRTYKVTPDPTTGRVLSLDRGNVTFYGRGATIKIADNVGNYVGVIVADTNTRDCSNTSIVGLTFDANHANNVPASEADLLGAMGGYARNRASIRMDTGRNIRVQDCTFLNIPRTPIWLGKNTDPDAMRDVIVTGNSFFTTVTGTSDWDNTAIFVLGDNLTITDNHIIGNGTNYYLSRTSIQASGSHVTVTGNKIDKYFRGPIVGNASYRRTATDIVVANNTVTNANGGIEIFSGSDVGITTGPGIRSLNISDNVVSLNKTGYKRDVSVPAYPVGIYLYPSSDLSIEHVKINDNTVYNDPAWVTDGDSLVFIGPGGTLSGTNRNIEIGNNTLVNSPRSAIAVDYSNVEGLYIHDNIIENPGQRTGATTGHLDGIRLGGSLTNVEIVDNHVTDSRGTHLIEATMYAAPTAVNKVRVKPGRLFVADAAVLPKVVLNGVTARSIVVLDRKVKRITADESVLNSTTLVGSGLSVTMLPGQLYRVTARLRAAGATTSDFKLGFTVPSAATGGWSGVGPANPTASALNSSMSPAAWAWSDTAIYGTVAGNDAAISVDGIVSVAAGGTFTVRFAQGTADAVNSTILRADSLLIVEAIDTIEELVA